MQIQLGGSSRQSGGGCVGKLIASIFGLVFLLAGLAFTFFIGREAWKVIETWTSWKEVPCEIISASASTDGDEESPYSFIVSYSYSHEGSRYTGRVLRSSASGFENFRPVQRRLLRYLPDTQHPCWVDPAKPEDAVLERRAPAFVLLVFFPLIFVAIGVTVIFAVWRKAAPVSTVTELGKRGMDPRRKRGILRVLFLLLILGGAGGLIGMRNWILGPIEAKSWQRAPARVLESHLRRHESTDSDGHHSVTWKIDILYEYEFGGRKYRSNSFGFVGGSSSGRASKEKILRQYSPGTRIEVVVKPSDPTVAVIDPGWSPWQLLALLPLAALLIGIFGLSRMRKAAPPAGETESVDSGSKAAAQGPLVLRPGGGRWLKVIGLLIFALFWNGIISIFVVQVVDAFKKGHPDWVLTIFMIPFVLVGIGVILLFFHSLFATANPKTSIHLESRVLRLGEELALRWEIRGRLSRMADFHILLSGSESATYRRGTNSYTDTEVFARIPVYDSGGGALLPDGRAVIEIPPDTMHSFKASNNKIIWKLEIQADVPHWPDVSDSWDIEILPAAVGGGDPWKS